jgi:hypothetical protein
MLRQRTGESPAPVSQVASSGAGIPLLAGDPVTELPMRPLPALLLAAAIALSPAVARADCAYDLNQAKGRLVHETDKDKAAAVRKLLAKAEQERKTSETECRNYVTRAWRALRAEPAPVQHNPGDPRPLPKAAQQ